MNGQVLAHPTLTTADNAELESRLDFLTVEIAALNKRIYCLEQILDVDPDKTEDEIFANSRIGQLEARTDKISGLLVNDVSLATQRAATLVEALGDAPKGKMDRKQCQTVLDNICRSSVYEAMRKADKLYSHVTLLKAGHGKQKKLYLEVVA